MMRQRLRLRKQWLFFVGLALGALIGSSSNATSQILGLEWISIIQVLAHPVKFHGKTIIVQGYATIEFEGTAVYLNELDAKNGLTMNGVWLQTPVEPFAESHQRYVLVKGTFNANNRGHFGMYSGTIEKILWLKRLR